MGGLGPARFLCLQLEPLKLVQDLLNLRLVRPRRAFAHPRPLLHQQGPVLPVCLKVNGGDNFVTH